MPYKLKDSVRHKFKKKSYNKRDWKTYDQNLQKRGSLTLWFSEESIKKWNEVASENPQRGRQRYYSDFSIEICQTLCLLFKQALRQTEGFVQSILSLLKVDLKIPDYTTLSRRLKTIKLSYRPKRSSPNGVIIVDSTGLKVCGEKEWMNTKHGTKQRKIWRKVHMMIDDDGTILSSTLTTHDSSDVSQVPDLLQEYEGVIHEFIGDSGGYDHPQTYETLKEREQKQGGSKIKVIVPPNSVFHRIQNLDPPERVENVTFIHDVGKHKWQKMTDYGRRSKVENVIYRYKTTIGRSLKSKNRENQKMETKIGMNILNQIHSLGIPRARCAA